jgi:hypothetical protein
VSGTAQSPTAQFDAFEIVGFRAAVGSTSDEVRGTLRSILRGFGAPAPHAASVPSFELNPAGSGWQVIARDEVVHEGGDFLVALGTLEFHLTSTALERATDFFHVHGAALCAPLRRAGLVIAGESGIGKTTLTLALMLRGFVPFSDDVALIEPDTLRLHPLRRAFHINADTWSILETLDGSRVTGDADGPPGYFSPPQWASEPVPVRWVLFPELSPTRPPALLPLEPSRAAGAILDGSGTLARNARLALSTTSRLVERAECYQLVSGDFVRTVTLIQSLTSA